MIIYHVHPFREYKFLNAQIQQQCVNTYQFHEPIELVNALDYREPSEVLAYHPSDQTPRYAYTNGPAWLKGGFEPINRKRNGLFPTDGKHNMFCISHLFGVFSQSRIRKYNYDFLYTFVEHPVDHVYNIYFYFHFAAKQLSNIQLFTGDYFLRPLESFVDDFIRTEGDITFSCQGLRYRFAPSVMRQRNLGIYDFVGIQEKMQSSLNILNTKLKTKFWMQPSLSKIVKPSSYRRTDLEILLKSDCEEYFAKYKLVP